MPGKKITPIEKIIERLDNEGANAYSAFLIYASLLPNERTGDKPLPIIAAKTGLSTNTLHDYRHAFDWDDRVALLESQRWLDAEKERQAQVAADNEKYVAQNRKIKERGNNISLQMMEVAEKFLTKALAADEIIEDGFVETKDGRRVATTTTIKVNFKASDVRHFTEAAFRVQRYIQDLPTEEVTHEIPLDVDLSKLSVEELLAMREENHRRMLEKGAKSGLSMQTVETEQ